MTAEGRNQRLRRLDLIFVRTPIYFITACTNSRRSILDREPVHETLMHFGEEGAKRGAWLGAYVLMPDYFHAFVGFDNQEIQLAAWTKSLKNSLSKTLRFRGIVGPHWHKDFFDHVLRSEESYEQKWQYVRENPVRAGLVKDWIDWQFQGEIFDLRYHSD